MKLANAIAGILLLGCGQLASAASEQTSQEIENLKELIKEQQKQIEQLSVQIEATAAEMEARSSKSAASAKHVSIGGYGEIHYNNIDDEKQLDFHRFVLFFGTEFTEDLRFFSELELEHSLAGDGKPGEVELEQAYIEYDLDENASVKGGLFLMPVGILNETHEPNTFYGVERNPIEKDIIPATWWEGGAAYTRRFANGFQFDGAITGGLDTGDAFNIRSGRQKVAEANADSLAYTARLKWTGMPGVELASTMQYQEDVTQGLYDASATLVEAHAAINRGNFGFRALYAIWSIDGDEAELTGRNEQSGYYLEPSYKLNENWGIFARYNEWDVQEGDDFDSAREQINAGFNYWPHPDVVVKADFEQRDGILDGDGFNIGLGYQF